METDRKLASIRIISDMRPIPDADLIEVAVVDGWECVVKKDDGFNVGDKIVYIEIDSVMPALPEFEFLAQRKYRVRTIKLRKQVSQGLVLPMSLLKKAESKYAVGTDVTAELGVTKYDPEAAEEAKLLAKEIEKASNESWVFKHIVSHFMRYKLVRELYSKYRLRSIVKRRNFFPGWITKTNEERVQNIVRTYENARANHTKFTITEKLDGSSATYYYKNGEFGVCSHNVWLKEEDDSVFWQMARKYNIKDKLMLISKAFNDAPVVIQGEVIGEKIQRNRYKLKGNALYLFNFMLNGKRQTQEVLDNIGETYGFNIVPVLYRNEELPSDMGALLALARGKSVNGITTREGLVVRNYELGLSFKVINNDYLLEITKQEDKEGEN